MFDVSTLADLKWRKLPSDCASVATSDGGECVPHSPQSLLKILFNVGGNYSVICAHPANFEVDLVSVASNLEACFATSDS